MKKILVLLVFAMMSTMGVMAQNNTVQLPYSANFTQHWTANGATVVDSNHVEFTYNGQEIVGPWMDLEAGMLKYIYTIRAISGTWSLCGQNRQSASPQGSGIVAIKHYPPRRNQKIYRTQTADNQPLNPDYSFWF